MVHGLGYKVYGDMMIICSFGPGLRSNFDQPAQHTGDDCTFRFNVCKVFFINILYFQCNN